MKVEQKQKTAASSPWDGENAYILAAVKWKKLCQRMELTDYLAKVLYLTEIPLCESTQKFDHSGGTRHGTFSLNKQKMFIASCG